MQCTKRKAVKGILMKESAYMTVEASFIVPAAIFIMMFIIYEAFYMYGRCLISQDAYIIGFRAVSFYEQAAFPSPSLYVSENADERLGRKYFGSDKPEVTSESPGKEMTVRVSMNTRHNAISGYFPALNEWKAIAAAKTKKTESAKKLRRIKRAFDIAGRVNNRINED